VDFAPAESQEAVARAAAAVLGASAAVLGQDQPPAAPARGMPSAGPPDLWPKLGRAGILSLAIPEWLGGDGRGVLDVAAALTEVGRQAAPVPALATLALGVLPVARLGDRDQQRDLLAGVAAGDTVLTAALREPSEPRPAVPAVVATLTGGILSGGAVSGGAVSGGAVSGGAVSGGSVSGGLGTVSGVKVGVPDAAAARWILVPATIAAGGTGVVVIDPADEGVSLTATPAAGPAPEYTLRLDAAPVRGLLGGAADGWAVADLYQLAIAGACAVADGAVAAALALTTSYVRSREQFGRPLAAFQAVAQQVADVYIAARTLHLTALSAAWQLDSGSDAGPDLDVAAYWLAQEAPLALRTCHHLHGGFGMDVSYPLHRYSALVKDLVRFVGGADYSLGALAAREGDYVP
jgi:alkylation response protein AidB-like acyl-CoA dehydrogenase